MARLRPVEPAMAGMDLNNGQLLVRIDTDLLLVITIWPSLALDTKRTILAVVRSQTQ